LAWRKAASRAAERRVVAGVVGAGDPLHGRAAGDLPGGVPPHPVGDEEEEAAAAEGLGVAGPDAPPVVLVEGALAAGVREDGHVEGEGLGGGGG
jgi:hypothetical protein